MTTEVEEVVVHPDPVHFEQLAPDAATVSSMCPTGATYAAVERGRRCAAIVVALPRVSAGSLASTLAGTGVRLGSDRLEHGPKISQHRHTLALRELLRSPQEFEAQFGPGTATSVIG